MEYLNQEVRKKPSVPADTCHLDDDDYPESALGAATDQRVRLPPFLPYGNGSRSQSVTTETETRMPE